MDELRPVRIVFSRNSQEVICALEALTSALSLPWLQLYADQLGIVVQISLKTDP